MPRRKLALLFSHIEKFIFPEVRSCLDVHSDAGHHCTETTFTIREISLGNSDPRKDGQNGQRRGNRHRAAGRAHPSPATRMCPVGLRGKRSHESAISPGRRSNAAA
jgi:hypothetical protein